MKTARPRPPSDPPLTGQWATLLEWATRLGRIAAPFGAILAGWFLPDDENRKFAFSILAGAAVVAGILLLQAARADDVRARGRYAFSFVSFTVLLLAGWNEVLGPIAWRSGGQIDAAPLIFRHRWITYNPSCPPWTCELSDTVLIARELRWIRAAGFDGIVTFGSMGPERLVPRIAKAQGLSVIMGVWDAKNRDEVAAAISMRRWVDAYTVGHNGLYPEHSNDYSYAELLGAVSEVRFRTRRPVSTTEALPRYLQDDRIGRLSDWLFPDAHVLVRDAETRKPVVDVKRDARTTFEMVRLIGTMRGSEHKPIMLKMVTYPMAGVTDASLQRQADFFTAILEARRDVLPALPYVAVAVHSAYDLPWKKERPYYDWDPHTGVLERNGRPRPVVRSIVELLPCPACASQSGRSRRDPT